MSSFILDQVTRCARRVPATVRQRQRWCCSDRSELGGEMGGELVASGGERWRAVASGGGEWRWRASGGVDATCRTR